MSDAVATTASETQVDYLAPVRAVLVTVPTVDEDPTPRMMAQMLLAQNPAEWETLFQASHFKEHAGQQIRVETIRVAPSEFKGRLGVYLLADVTILATGEQTVMTIGSEMAMAQLLNCWQRQDFPHDFEIVVKDKPTKNGFLPMRLRSLGKVVQAQEG